MAIAKVIFNNEPLVDLLNDTVASDKMYNNYTALNSHGISVIGNTSWTDHENELIDKTLSGVYSNSELISLVNYVFCACELLEGVDFPNVTTIGTYSFYYCYSLQYVNIPKLEAIPNYAFYRCTSLSNVNFLFATSIGTYAFHTCSSLATANIPEATSIGTYAFYDCTSLTSITAPKVTSIETYAFCNCTHLQSANFPLTTGAIGDYTFENCYALTSLNMPNVTSIGAYGLHGTIALEVVNLPSVTSIPGSRIIQSSSGCGKTMVLPAITSLGSDAFRQARIDALDLGEGLASLPTRCFYSNTGGNYYHDIILRRTSGIVTATATNCIQALTAANGTKIYVPQALVATYKSATNWSGKASLIYPIEGSQYDGYYADGTPIPTS